MKLAHSVKVNVFEYEDNNPELVEQDLKTLFPFPIDEFLIIRKAEGFEKIIRTYDVIIYENRKVNGFLDALKNRFNQDQKDMLLRQLDTRLDEDICFFLRIDKEKLREGKFYVTDLGNCFHVKINIAAFPKRRDIALKMIKEWLET